MTNTSKLFITVLTLLAMTASVYAKTPREDLREMLARLKELPDDSYSLRRSMKLARKINPAPNIPAEAHRAASKGEYTFKHATTTRDYVLAAEQFKTARTLAPWVAEYHFNLAAAYEQSGQIENAIYSLENYLYAAPNATDANAVNRNIGKLQGAKDERRIKAWGRLQPDKQFVNSLEGKHWICAEKNGEPSHFSVRRGILYFTFGKNEHYKKQVSVMGKEFPGWGTPLSKLNGEICYDKNNRSICGANGWFSDDAMVIVIPELAHPIYRFDDADNETALLGRAAECCQEFACLRDR
jgi:tetratricopeptide (TPR) repeat protein